MLQTSLLLAVSDKTVNTIQIVTICVLIAAAALIAVLSFVGRKAFDTRSIVYAGVCLAASFALSYVKFELPYGGSITLMSFVPILLYAYFFGPVRGLAAGFVYGLLQFVQSPWILTPLSFILDYLLAFTCIGLIGFMRMFTKNRLAGLLGGTGIVYFFRLVMHVLAGLIYFENGVIADGLPTSNAFVYSLCYNLFYLAPDCALCMIAMAILISQKVVDRLEKIAVGPVRAAEAPAPGDAAPVSDEKDSSEKKSEAPEAKDGDAKNGPESDNK